MRFRLSRWVGTTGRPYRPTHDNSGRAAEAGYRAVLSTPRHVWIGRLGDDSSTLGALVIGGMLAVAACSDRARPGAPPIVHVDPAHVTGVAARALDARGRFVLPEPEQARRFPQLTRDRAVTLASAFVSDFARVFSSRTFERQHGAPIDGAGLRPCGHAYYLRSPFEPPGGEVNISARNYIGPHWLVSFCSPTGVPQLSVSIAADATNMLVRDGHIAWDTGHRVRGNEAYPVGIPLGTDYPISPERAVEIVATRTGRRVANVPELVDRRMGGSPQSATWKLVLDAPVRVRGARAGRESDERVIYIGADDISPGTVALCRGIPAAGSDPPEAMSTVRADDPDGPIIRLPLTRRAGVPRYFERITVIHSER